MGRAAIRFVLPRFDMIYNLQSPFDMTYILHSTYDLIYDLQYLQSSDLSHYGDMRSAGTGWYSSPATDPRFASEYCEYLTRVNIPQKLWKAF